MDYRALLLDPIYDNIGVPAVITLADGVTFVELTAIDKTAGVEIGDNKAKVESIEPGACIRVYEWKALGRVPLELEDATMQLNGSVWDVQSFKIRPSPGGPRDGEFLLILANETIIPESGDSSESSP